MSLLIFQKITYVSKLEKLQTYFYKMVIALPLLIIFCPFNIVIYEVKNCLCNTRTVN